MGDRQATLLLAAYILIAVITFGHAAAKAPCITADMCQMDKTMQGLVGGMFWPLYWSWEIFE